MRRLIFKLFFSLLIVIISILIAFFLAEKFYFDKLLYKKSPLHGYGDNYLVENNFFMKWRFRDLLKLTNSDYNWENFEKERRDKKTFVIAVIGDSIPFGVGVRGNQTFAHLLEKKLNTARSTSVLLFANSGDTIIHNYAKFLLAKEKVRPDLSIIGVVDNDLLIDGEDNLYPNSTEVFRVLSNRCPQPLFSYSFEKIENHDQAVQQIFYPSFSSKFSGLCFLQEISYEFGQQKDSIIFYDFQHIPGLPEDEFPYETSLNRQSRVPRQTYVKTLRVYGNFVIGFDLTQNHWDPVSLLEGHPSARMHKKFADQLFEEITQNPKWRFYE